MSNSVLCNSILVSSLGLCCVSAIAGACSNYPYKVGVSVEALAEGTQIISTASVVPFASDAVAVKDAFDEATLEAKATISKFIKEDISSSETLNKSVSEIIVLQDGDSSKQRKVILDKVQRLQNSSSALLKGVVILGDCYTFGREVRVSVGIHPDTIANAERLANDQRNKASLGRGFIPDENGTNLDSQ